MKTLTRQRLFWLVAIVALLPVVMLRELSPDNELRYVEIVREALANGHSFAFTLQGQPYADKPPLFFWLMMAFQEIFGSIPSWSILFLSLLPALLTIHVMNSWTSSSMHNQAQESAGLMLLTSVYFLGPAIVLRMDMLMCLFIVLALRSAWRIAQGQNSEREHWLLPLWLFLAVFTKGPLGLLIPLVGSVSYLCLSHQPRLILRCWGWRTWLPLVLLCLLWFGAVWAEGGTDYLNNLLFHQTFGRAVSAFHHARPFWYYALCIWYCLAPWSPLVAVLIVLSLRRGFPLRGLQCYFLSTGLSCFVLLSMLSGKLQVYLLPALPFLVYGAAMTLPRQRDSRWVKAALALPSALFALALPMLFLAIHLLHLPVLHHLMLFLAATLLTVSGILSLFRLYIRGGARAAGEAIRLLAIGLLTAVYTAGWALPELNDLL